MLAVREGSDDGAQNANLVSECGEREDGDVELVVESERGALDVNLTTRSVNAFPSRGVLIHYKGMYVLVYGKLMSKCPENLAL